MSQFIMNRRRLIGLGAAGASSLVLAGCDQFDFLGVRNDPTRNFLERANELTYAAQRALVGEQSLAHEYAASEIRQPQRPNGSTDPNTADYLALKANNFADYKLKVTGLVETPVEFTLDELRNMPARIADHPARLCGGMELHRQVDGHAARRGARPGQDQAAGALRGLSLLRQYGRRPFGAGALLRDAPI